MRGGVENLSYLPSPICVVKLFLKWSMRTSAWLLQVYCQQMSWNQLDAQPILWLWQQLEHEWDPEPVANHVRMGPVAWVMASTFKVRRWRKRHRKHTRHKGYTSQPPLHDNSSYTIVCFSTSVEKIWPRSLTVIFWDDFLLFEGHCILRLRPRSLINSISRPNQPIHSKPSSTYTCYTAIMLSFRPLLFLAAIAGSALACTDDATYQITLPNTQPPPLKQVVPCSYITENQKKKAIRIANLCPTHKTKCPLSCGTCVVTASPAPSMAPEASPSAKPSVSAAPSMAPFASPSAAPSKSSKPTVSCADSATYTFKVEFSGNMEKCSWLTKNADAKKDAARILKYCADTQTKFQCAKTCDTCKVPPCVDSATHTFVLPDAGNTVDCSYISKNIKKLATRQTKLCPAQGASCPKACGYCQA